MLTAQESEDRWCIFTQICTTCEDVYWMRAHGTEFLTNQQATCYLDETIAKDPDVWIIQTGMSVISRIDRQSA